VPAQLGDGSVDQDALRGHPQAALAEGLLELLLSH
jgi:hypothetical protein